MEDLEKYVDFLFGDQQGFVYSPIKKPDDWVSEFFAWPTERTELLDHIKVNGSEHDVYICPSVFSKKEAKKDSFKSSQVVWVEFDGKEQINFKGVPTPDTIVQTSSSTHLHCYWRTGKITKSEALDEVNRRLTYYLQADSSGWDCTQLLRPPTSKNVKRGGLPVLLAHFDDKAIPRPISSFDEAPKVETKTVEITEAQLIDPTKLIPQLPLLKSLRFKIEKEQVEVGQRSQFLYKIAHELAEIGCDHTQIASVISYVNDRIGKFPKSRSDWLIRISELASIAIHAVGVENDISLYSPKDVLEHTEELEWIYEKWLHNQGLMIVTGAPGVGKTQFCLQLMNAFSVGGSFLTSALIQKKVLFWSLEMDIRELKFILQKQALDYQNLDLYFKNSKFADEPGTFLQFEEILEDYKPGVVIIDSLFELADGDLKDGAEVIQLTRWLKRMRKKYGCAIILIHHNRKGNGNNKKPNRLEDMFGSVVLNKEIDTAFCLWQEEDQESIDLYPVKARFSQRTEMTIERTEHLTFNFIERDSDNESGNGGLGDIFNFQRDDSS